MANRTRPNQILFFVSDDEKRIIKAKMAQLGTKNMGAYGNDNPGAKSQGIKQLMAGGGVVLIGTTLIPLLSGLFG